MVPREIHCHKLACLLLLYAPCIYHKYRVAVAIISHIVYSIGLPSSCRYSKVKYYFIARNEEGLAKSRPHLVTMNFQFAHALNTSFTNRNATEKSHSYTTQAFQEHTQNNFPSHCTPPSLLSTKREGTSKLESVT